MTEFRTERDSMGDVQVPAQAYYGAQTQRAVDNFPVSGWRLPTELVHALGRVKLAAAVANRDLGKLTGSGKNPLTDDRVETLLASCQEVIDGKLDDPVWEMAVPFDRFLQREPVAGGPPSESRVSD